MAEKKISYTDAFAALQDILTEIEDGTISLDELSDKVKHASQLIEVCRKKLTSTENDVAKILDRLSDTTTPEPDEGKGG